MNETFGIKLSATFMAETIGMKLLASFMAETIGMKVSAWNYRHPRNTTAKNDLQGSIACKTNSNSNMKNYKYPLFIHSQGKSFST